MCIVCYAIHCIRMDQGMARAHCIYIFLIFSIESDVVDAPLGIPSC